MKITQPELLNTIFKQALATAACFKDEERGIRQYAATEKAMRVIEQNETITFENGVLRFFSLESGKFRIVTKNGCHTTCECRGIYSYHVAMFDLLETYFALLAKREVKPVIAKTEITTVAHSDRQQSDRFTEANMPYFPKPLYTPRKSESLTKGGPRF